MFKLIFFVLINIKFGYSFPDGAPDSVCKSMMPQHTVVPKQCQPKYIIQSEKTEYNTNDIIRITVRGLTDADYFKGIFLIAKNKDNQQIIGTWTTNDRSIKTISCEDEKDNTAITHTSNDKKLQVEALWHAPSTVYEKNTIIKATIVKSFDEIYVDCFSITLTAKQHQLIDVQSKNVQSRNDIITKPNTNVTLNYADATVRVSMTSEYINTGDWRAIGFSLDQEMGDEYIFICQVSNAGTVSLRRMHTKAGKRPPSNSLESVIIVGKSYENGRLTCEFSFETISDQIENEPAPIVTKKDYHILFAAGILRTDVQVTKHNFTFVTPTTFQLQEPKTLILNDLFNSANVNDTTTTTPAPSTDDIEVNINWTYASGSTNIRMMINNLKTSQWCALGLSENDLMGEDHVFICQRLSSDTISLERFINPNDHERPKLASTIANPGGTLNVNQVKLENRVVYCDFTLSNFVNIKRQSRQNNISPLSQTTTYRPLIAIGNLDSSNSLVRHGQNSRAPLMKNVLLNRQENLVFSTKSAVSDSPSLMKAHGIIMIFTWILFVSTGILIARYFKRSWGNKKICDKAVWFAIHRTIMISVAILTLIAFILILVHKKGQWVSKTSQREFAHSIVGILVISFAVIQPLMALFRCDPSAQYRFIFNYAHATVGFSAFLLSIVAIFLALFFTQFEFEVKKEWAIIIGWACWVPIVFISFEIIEIYFRKSSTKLQKTEEYDMNNDSNDVTTKVQTLEITESYNKNRIKKILILIHITVGFGFALALAIIVGRS